MSNRQAARSFQRRTAWRLSIVADMLALLARQFFKIDWFSSGFACFIPFLPGFCGFRSGHGTQNFEIIQLVLVFIDNRFRVATDGVDRLEGLMIKITPDLLVFQQGIFMSFQCLDHCGRIEGADPFNGGFIFVKDGIRRSTGSAGITIVFGREFLDELNAAGVIILIRNFPNPRVRRR